jgi:hypothetical protein
MNKNVNKIENKKDFINQNNNIEFENKVSGINFIGNYKILGAGWTQGLKLSVKDLLMHSSDLQVKPIVYLCIHTCRYIYIYIYICIYIYIYIHIWMYVSQEIRTFIYTFI